MLPPLPRPTRHPIQRAQALAALPDPDFLLAMYLVPDSLHASESVATLVELERLLQTAQFRAFWVAAKAPAAQALVGRVAGFDASVRDFIARIVSRTYQKIDAAALAAELDVVRPPAAVRVPPPLVVDRPLRGTAAALPTASPAAAPAPPQNDVAAFVEARGWTLDAGVVSLPLVADNTPRARRAGEEATASIKYADVAPLVNMLARQ